ncbi:Flp family type IVb pilin [Chromohalobacter israelensis]|uniref:Flp/Fap pilin component n=2 Tax=Chromohalobacter israelensis TaxID=141390 RepID=Q1QWZ9_CHRI1|nr:Flp family type IVb pilin [Chromohalobacter salexigens]ABE59009.1 Flp/Fap pilin component [Chromohalobacter salexigens DSM 3043]
MRNSLFDKVTTFSQRLAARGHAQRPLNHARFKRQQGATAIEYAIIAGVVAVVIIAVFNGDEGLQNIFGGIFDSIAQAVGTAEDPDT